MLGSPFYSERQRAERNIAAMGTAGMRRIAAACSAKDAEIRMRGERLLRRLFRCPDCGGDGVCPVCYGEERDCAACNSRFDCRRCAGSGDTRYGLTRQWLGAANGDGGYLGVLYERDLVGEWLVREMAKAGKRVAGP